MICSLQQVLVVMFAIVPIVASIARFAIRLKNHRKPTWDDYFVLCATVCLIIETALVLDCQEELYELEFSPMPAMSLFTTSRISRFYIKTFIFTCLVWTAIFSIKLSFLALFRGLVWDISRRLKWFYIFVVGLTILTWFLIILQITLQNTLGCPALTEFACESVLITIFVYRVTHSILQSDALLSMSPRYRLDCGCE